jgi:hypothetical protein
MEPRSAVMKAAVLQEFGAEDRLQFVKNVSAARRGRARRRPWTEA